MSRLDGGVAGDPGFAADVPNAVIEALIARVNDGDETAAPELVGAELDYIRRQTAVIARVDSAQLTRQPAWVTSASNSVCAELIADLGRFARECNARPSPPTPAPHEGEPRREPLVVALRDRVQFREIIRTAIRRHVWRLEYHRRQAIIGIRPQESHLVEDLRRVAIRNKADFEDLISLLGDGDRQLLRWQYIDGLSQREMAVQLKVTVSAVSKKLQRAMETLRLLLEENEPPPSPPTDPTLPPNG